MTDNLEQDIKFASALGILVRVMTWIFGISALATAVLGAAADSHPHVLASWFLTGPFDQGTARLKFMSLVLVMFVVAAILSILLILAQRRLSADALLARTRLLVERAEAEAAREVADAQGQALAATSDRDDAVQAQRQTMGAMARVLAGWRTSAANEESWRYKRVEERYDVEADGTTTSTRTYDLEAVEQVIGFRVHVIADETATPAANPSDIEFNVQSMTNGRQVEWVVVDNGPLAKTFAMMFVPPLKPGQKIRFQVRHRWKGFTADLLSKGKTEFSFSFASAAETDRANVAMTFAFASALGPLALSLSDGAPGRLTRQPSGGGYDQNVWFYSVNRMKMRGQSFSVDVAKS